MGILTDICPAPDSAILDFKQECFARIKGRAVAFHYTKFTAFTDLAEAQVYANWEALTAPQIGTPAYSYMTITPQIVSNLEIVDNEALKEGTDGGYDTAEGVEIVTGQTKQSLNFDFKFLTPENNARMNAINQIQRTGLSMFILDPDSNIITAYQTEEGAIVGIPIIPNSGYTSSGGGVSGEQTKKRFTGKIVEDFDEKYIQFRLNDKTVQEMLNLERTY